MKKAFTLIELLVVIAIIALLLSIVVPSLRLARMKASSVVCMTNTKNMSLAWFSYQSDNNGRIMSARMDGVDSGTYVGWIGAPYQTNPGDISITQSSPLADEDAIRGIRRGRLHEYLNSPKSYKCPGDTLRKSVYSGINPYVSYSMPTCLYAQTNPSHERYNLQIMRYNQFTSQSQRYIYVEVAQERNWNMSGWFSFGAPEWTGDFSRWGWWDPLAINHGDSSIIGYADGHAVTRRWQDPFTRERVAKLSGQSVDNYGIDYPPVGQTADIEFMASGWAFRYRP